MRLFWNYLYAKRRTILCFLLCALIFFVTFLLFRLPIVAVLYPTALCVLLGCVFFLLSFLRYKKKYDCLNRIRTLTAEMITALPKAGHSMEQTYQDILSGLVKQAIQKDADFSAKYRDMTEYYTLWAHQIKTPIASMRLTLQNEDTPLARKLSSDLFRIEQYVEMVLAFLRLDSTSTDFLFRTLSLDDILKSSVRKFASDFITKKIRLDYTAVSETVVSDEKWLCFVVEQILSNAIKYTPSGGCIRIYMQAPKTLCIADTGIGIAPEDLPRIFEKGYTGYNGRTDKSASGIGLYLCKRVCEKLCIPITVQSTPDVGTVLRLDLGQYRTY